MADKLTMGERVAQAWGKAEAREPQVYALVEDVRAHLEAAVEDLVRLGNAPVLDANSVYHKTVRAPLFQHIMAALGGCLEGLYNAEFGAAMTLPEAEKAEKVARLAQLAGRNGGKGIH